MNLVSTKGSLGDSWAFLSKHGQVLIWLAREPHVRMRDVSARIGITERAVHRLLGELEAAGLVERHRAGRRNVYELHLDRPIVDPVGSRRTVGELVDLLVQE